LPFRIFESDAKTILSPVSGYLAEAGFTHSLSPARNCTFGCSYCYVPTMRFQAGLKPEDWSHWGEWSTFKSNAAGLLARALRPDQTIYCSPLTDPYQPAEADQRLMPGILETVALRPPRVFVIQTRGPLILRDVELLQKLAGRTTLRVSFSVTTDRDDVRRIFEPHCAPIEERWRTIEALRDAGIEVTATIAPILPCDPEALVERAIRSTRAPGISAMIGLPPLISDSLHVRAVKRSGATTRPAAVAICQRHGWSEWLDPAFQTAILSRMQEAAARAGRVFGHGPQGFRLLTRAVF
jgi:DNA repair photolyase